MSKLVQVYLTFGGRCEEAIEFYKTAIGAQPEAVMRFDESPEPPPPGMVPPNYGKKIMHSSFRVGDTVVMASDGCGPAEGFKGFSLALTVKTEADAKAAFAALSDGGKVTMPLSKTFWSPCFGMVTDRFGVSWMVMVDEGCVD